MLAVVREANVRKFIVLIFAVALGIGISSAWAQMGWGPSIRIFAGKDNKMMQGCLTCPPQAPDSLFNLRSDYGRCANLGTSSDDVSLPCRKWPSEDVSPCSDQAKKPPLMFDDQGTYYGAFSLGGVHGHPDSVCNPESLYQSEGACRVVRDVCSGVALNYALEWQRTLNMGLCDGSKSLAWIDAAGKFIKLSDGAQFLVESKSRGQVLRDWFTGDPVYVCPGGRLASPRRREVIFATLSRRGSE